MRRLMTLAVAALMLLTATPSFADGWRHGGGRFHYHRHSGGGAVVVGALVGGLVLGSLLARPVYAAPPYYPAPMYYAPPPAPLVLGNCQATTGTGYLYGRPALYGGTMCFDRYGRGYIQPGSEYFIDYLN